VANHAQIFIETNDVVYEKMICSFNNCTLMQTSRIPCRHWLRVAQVKKDLEDSNFYTKFFPKCYLKVDLLAVLQTFRYHPIRNDQITDSERTENVCPPSKNQSSSWSRNDDKRIKSSGE